MDVGVGNDIIEPNNIQVDQDTEQILRKSSILLLKCVEVMTYEGNFQQLLMSPIFIEDISKTHFVGTPHLIVAEKQLLTMSTYPDCTGGILYAMPLIVEANGQCVLYLRCFESGVYRRFFRSSWHLVFQELVVAHSIKECFVINIYNDWDSLAAQTHRTSLRKDIRPLKNSKILKNITMLNKTSLNWYLPIAHAVLKKEFGLCVPGFFVYCQRMARHTKHVNATDNWYFKVEGLGNPSTWENCIKHFATDQSFQLQLRISEVVNQYADMEELSLFQHCVVLSTCPNYHHWVSKKIHGVKKEEYFLPNGKSPRNKLMNIVLQSNYMKINLNEIYSLHEHIVAILQLIQNNKFHIDSLPTFTVMKRKQIRIVRKVCLESNDLVEHLGISNDEFESLRTQSEMSLSVYESYKKHLFNGGTILWRVYSNRKQVVVMNDYHSEKRDFKFNDYASVTRLMEDNSISFWCTCETYKVLMTTVQLNYGQTEWDGVTCCHCRILSEIILKYPLERNLFVEHGYHSSSCSVQDESVIAKKISEAFQAVTFTVISLPSIQKDVKKFSVRVMEEVESVHIFKSKINENVFVSCCSGICQSRFSKKRNVINLYKNTELCQHLLVFKDYIIHNKEKHSLLTSINENANLGQDNEDDEGLDRELFDDYIETVDIDEADDQDTNEEPTSGGSKFEYGFNKETGMWLFYSPYGRKVNMDSFDVNLIRNCVDRQKCSLLAIEDPAFISCFYPSCDSEECDCELPWRKDENGDRLLEFDCSSTLYTKLFAIPCKVFKMVCVNRQCIIRWNGVHENIFRISSLVCIGEEMCWDFIDMVKSMKCNFSAYCSLMNSSYNRHRSARLFMSPETFRRLFFSWASHQFIDFRNPCNWCGYSPKVLACDATKIGITQRYCHIEPIEQASGRVLKTNHRRYDRCFLSYPVKTGNETTVHQKEKERVIRESRSHMKSIMNSVGGSAIQQDMTAQQLMQRNKELVDVFPDACKPMLSRVMAQNMSVKQLAATSRLFYMLSFDAPLRSLVPNKLLPSIEKFVNENSNFDIHLLLAQCRKFNHCLGDFVSAYHDNGVTDRDAISVVRFICRKIRKLHDEDILPEDHLSMPGSYNSPKLGRAYYFTPTGAQVRQARCFDFGNVNHDDAPSCSNKFPMVSKKGSTFLFLWFCPMYGHCYGCHIVNGSQGRKDSANSLYTHLPKAPETIFYDFSCSLKEYCMNRESGYFKDTRFFHDLFHGYSHNCSSVYSSKGLHGLQSVNTSICEQFNSYLQCIKSSAKQMCQEHFMFFTQFMIDIWNNKKKQAFSNKLKVALSGAS